MSARVAAIALGIWLAGSVAFRFYVVNFGSYNATYGAIGGVKVLMLWLYLSGLVIIVGAEMNAEIEHASPHGKEPGEKVPGQLKKVGPRAAREFEERKRQGAIRPVTPVRGVAHAAPGKAAARGGVLLGGVIAAVFGRRIKD